MYNEDIQQILNIKKGLQNMSKELLNFGIVGAGGRRTKVFMNTFRKSGRARLAAVCDINCEALEEGTKGIPDVLKYTDYEEMLENWKANDYKVNMNEKALDAIEVEPVQQ